MRRLEGVDNVIVRGSNKDFSNIQKEFWKEYEEVILQEEMYWHQRARCGWLALGDKNTHFFHMATNIKKKRLTIEMLRDDDGTWWTNQNHLKHLASNFYRKLYANEQDIDVDFAKIPNCFPKLQEDVLLYIQREVKDDDVKAAVFSIKATKAPGPDGIHGIFLQNQWRTVGGSICSFVRDVFHDLARIKEVNDTLLALIPKFDHPDNMKDFRPVALCNVIYKVITKIVANRLKEHMDFLVGKNQCSFISGRNSYDNIIIAQEIIHSMERKKGRKGLMAVKVDLKKAYDRIPVGFP